MFAMILFKREPNSQNTVIGSCEKLPALATPRKYLHFISFPAGINQHFIKWSYCSLVSDEPAIPLKLMYRSQLDTIVLLVDQGFLN